MTRARTTCETRQHPRRGTAIIVAVICLTLITAMGVSLVRLALASHEQTERGLWRMQSAWLAESGLSRAITRLDADDEYAGENWTVQEIGPARDEGTVTITVEADETDASQLTVTATADFPNDAVNRVRTTRRITLQRSNQDGAQQPSEDE